MKALFSLTTTSASQTRIRYLPEMTSPFLQILDSAESDREFGHPPPTIRVKQQACKIDIPPTEITDLQNLVSKARLGPVTFENSQPEVTKEFGLTRSWMSKAIQAWSSESTFNWNKIQDNINSIPQFISTVNHNNHSYSIHYMALWSLRADATPLVCIHGWPGCFIEYLAVAKLLQSKYTPDTLPYHFIVPSLPGYTFSSGPPADSNGDFSTYDVSCIFRSLFIDQLGFDQKGYIVAGGDIGSRVCRALAVDDEHCKGIHLTFCFDFDMRNFPRQGLKDNELRDIEAIETFVTAGAAYAQMHATRSATIGFVLSSNPVALLAWIAEKFLEWTDLTPDMETILTFMTLYWVTDTFSRSIYPYRHDFVPSEDVPCHGDGARWLIPRSKVFGFSHFPKEILPVPKAWVERTAVAEEVTFWREHEQGGHFAGVEVPGDLLEDLQEFVEHVRTRK
ncbi:epoxide hydrolase, putative [Talaromyces stipitatus ATCC 10500]|uniref:Epoxide hydrolase, putative n=1 Tax=Talaromyces stipitatus (strain ATCC 10500 / CBS 375.48 / QM 6759 / NRRL 1006) TaxID=441959 RepID=B8LT16_TALSN|nr:epoxide hydrolase, putative [Talaromyces stipitatus ATCC 10500]EED23524.1 epoxide hydrolase, putative [Talaromyces stipitatus ATCC 10500]